MAEEKLINLVRLHECLYNIKSRHYSDQHMKHNAWEQIAKELNKTRRTQQSVSSPVIGREPSRKQRKTRGGAADDGTLHNA